MDQPQKNILIDLLGDAVSGIPQQLLKYLFGPHKLSEKINRCEARKYRFVVKKAIKETGKVTKRDKRAIRRFNRIIAEMTAAVFALEQFE